MNAESLRALLIDRELGELTPEAVELLESWIAEHPDAVGEAGKVRETLEVAEATVRKFPELGRPDSNVIPLEIARFRAVPLRLAASIAVLLGISAWVGFRAGQESSRERFAIEKRQPISSLAVNTTQGGGPWAKYSLVSSPQGGLTVVRSDLKN